MKQEQLSKNALMIDAAYDVEDAIDAIYVEMDRIQRALRQFPDVYERARRYWMAHIDGALLNRGGWLGGSFITAESTLNELRGIDDRGRRIDDDDE